MSRERNIEKTRNTEIKIVDMIVNINQNMRIARQDIKMNILRTNI